MTQENARYYSGLTQAWDLAFAGNSIEQTKIALTQKGMSLEDARYYAGLTQQAKITDSQGRTDAMKAAFADSITNLDPKSADYQTKIQDLINTYFPA